MLQVSTRGSKRKAAPPDPFEQSDGEGESRLTAATPMENPYCSCKLTRVRSGTEGARSEDNEDATDNAICALGKICLKHSDVTDVSAVSGAARHG